MQVKPTTPLRPPQTIQLVVSTLDFSVPISTLGTQTEEKWNQSDPQLSLMVARKTRTRLSDCLDDLWSLGLLQHGQRSSLMATRIELQGDLRAWGAQ